MKFFWCLLLAAAMPTYGQTDYISLRMLTYNIQHGAGTDNVVDLDRQAEVIRNVDADIVGLQEVDSVVRRSDRVYQAGYLAQTLGMHATFGPAIPLTGGKYGVAILSKEAPISVRNIPLPGAEARTLLVCEFQEYVFACTHLDLEEENRLASLPIIIEEASRHVKPFFICGDWNDKPSSTLIKTMKQDFQILNSVTAVNSSYTFPASKPTTLIDYIASYGKVVKAVRSRRVINAPSQSDHRPVMVEVVLEPLATGIKGIQSSTDPLTPFRGNEVGNVKDPLNPFGSNEMVNGQWSNAQWYDMSGKRVSATRPKPGLYIESSGRRKVAVL